LAVAVRRLAAGDLGETIVINGPSDMQALGHCLEGLRAHLNELEDAKHLFMQSVALEFDGALDGLQADMELLVTQTENAPSHEQHVLALLLCKKIEKLKAVSQELARFSQINKSAEQGKEMVNLKELAESILDSFQPQLQAKSISVMKLIRPVEIFGVYDQLQNIISQLLANAVQYSPQGGEIRIMLRDFNDQLELEVEDEGLGINVEDSAFVFEPFFRSKTAESSEFDQGTGLGLAFVREYVANHHGKVDILASRQDQAGTRILVQIPLTQAV
jgi:two-component system sensor histidine kinase GlrK